MTSPGVKPNKLVKNATTNKPPHLKPPTGVSKEYRAVWKLVVEDFESTHFWESDRPILQEYVECYLKLLEVRKECAMTPYTVQLENGSTKIHAIHDLESKLKGLLVSYARTLKIAPTSRLQSTQTPKESEWHKKRAASNASKQKKAKAQVVGLRLA